MGTSLTPWGPQVPPQRQPSHPGDNTLAPQGHPTAIPGQPAVTPGTFLTYWGSQVTLRDIPDTLGTAHYHSGHSAAAHQGLHCHPRDTHATLENPNPMQGTALTCWEHLCHLGTATAGTLAKILKTVLPPWGPQRPSWRQSCPPWGPSTAILWTPTATLGSPSDILGTPPRVPCHPTVDPAVPLGTLVSLGDFVFLDLRFQPPPWGPSATSGALYHPGGFGTTLETPCHLRDSRELCAHPWHPVPNQGDPVATLVTPCPVWVPHAHPADPMPTLVTLCPSSPWPPGPGSCCAAAPGSHPVLGSAPRSGS